MARSINTTASRTNTTDRHQDASVSTPTQFRIGSVWKTSSDVLHYAGEMRPASGDYRNEQSILDRLPAAPEGFSWRIKLFVNRSTKPNSPAYDIKIQLEEDKRD